MCVCVLVCSAAERKKIERREREGERKIVFEAKEVRYLRRLLSYIEINCFIS